MALVIFYVISLHTMANHSDDQLMTPQQLYAWAVDKIQSVHYELSSIEKKLSTLNSIFFLSRTIPGTRKYHCFILVSSNKVKLAYYSSSTTLRLLWGFVICSSEHKWWLACVIKTILIESCVQLTFLHPHGPSSSSKYPAHQDIHTIALDNVLVPVDPRTTSGCTYSLTREENKDDCRKFKEVMMDS